jgi:hypothetical protein
MGCGSTPAASVHERDPVLPGNDAGRRVDAGPGCGGVVDRDVTVRTPAELEALRGQSLVAGNLIVACPDCETLEPLGCLTEVGLMLSVVGCDRLRSLEGLSALRRLGLAGPNGGLAIGFFFEPWDTHGNAELRTLSGLGPLERAVGRIDVRDNPKLEDLVGIASVRELQGAMFLTHNPSLASLQSLDGLAVVNSLSIEDNDALVDLHGLEHVVALGLLAIQGNERLATLAGLDHPWQFSESVSQLGIADNPALTDVSALSKITGLNFAVRFLRNSALREVVLSDTIHTLASDLNVQGNSVLERFELPGLAYVDRDVTVADNPALTVVDIGRPLHVGPLTITGNAALPDTRAFEGIRIADGYVRLSDNTALSTASLAEMQEISGYLEVRGNPNLETLDLRALRSAASVTVERNARLSNCAVDPMAARVAAAYPPTVCDNAADSCERICPEVPRP